MSSTVRTNRRGRILAAMIMGIYVVVVALLCAAAPPPTVTLYAEIAIKTSTPTGARAQQTLDMLNAETPITDAAVHTLANDEASPAVESVLTKLWPDRPYRITRVRYDDGRIQLYLTNAFRATQRLEIRTDDAGEVNHLDSELVRPVIQSWSDVDSALASMNAAYSYRVSDVTDGWCKPVAGTNPSGSLPLASVFKLYVLYAVAEAVNAGTLAWDDELTVTGRARAVEFTALPEYPAGSTISVRQAAGIMISVSSNMATDLLIDRLGKPALESALVATGHHDPQRMTPFPTMHELFSIGWGALDLRRQWADAVGSDSPEARAQLLRLVDAVPYQPDPTRSAAPASPYGVEWYASAEDICRLHVALQTRAIGPAAPVREILSAVPGIEVDSQAWPYIAAKGGNLPGDLTFSWYAVHRSGHAYVVSFQLNWSRAMGPSAVEWVLSIARQVFAIAADESSRTNTRTAIFAPQSAH